MSRTTFHKYTKILKNWLPMKYLAQNAQAKGTQKSSAVLVEAEQADTPLTHHVAPSVVADGWRSEMSRLSVVNQSVSLGSHRGEDSRLQEHPFILLQLFHWTLITSLRLVAPSTSFLGAPHYLPRFPCHSLCLAHLLSIVYQLEVNFLRLPLSGQCSVPESPQGSRQQEARGRWWWGE